jgi:ATP-binding cassette, subfamily B, bacterial IrtA/YbtP
MNSGSRASRPRQGLYLPYLHDEPKLQLKQGPHACPHLLELESLFVVEPSGWWSIHEAPPVPGRALYRVLTPVRSRLVSAVAVAAVAAGVGVGVGGFVLIALALRELLAADPSGTAVTVLLAGALVNLLARFGLRAPAFRMSHLASFDLEVHLRTTLAEHLGRIPLGEVQRLGSGAVKKIVQDDVRALHIAVADSVPLLGFS